VSHVPARAALLLALLLAIPAGADNNRAVPVECDAVRERELDAIVQHRLLLYEGLFPKIQFVVLTDRLKSGVGLLELLQLLGRDATNLDYEHPPQLRADLLEVSIARVATHLRNNATSSALFKAGQGAAATREQLCVLTLDACVIARDNRQATHHMLGLPGPLFARMQAGEYLDADQHLEYVIDHEVRHCLAAHRGHPIPMSTREYWAGYSQHRNEYAADAYALAMHILNHGAGSGYARTMTHIRGLAMLQGDPDHFTASAMQAVPETLKSVSSHASGLERAYVVAETIRERLDPGYDGYLKFRYAAHELMRDLGLPDESGRGVLAELPGYQPERDRVEALFRDLSGHYRALFGQSLNVRRD